MLNIVCLFWESSPRREEPQQADPKLIAYI